MFVNAKSLATMKNRLSAKANEATAAEAAFPGSNGRSEDWSVSEP